MTRMYLCVYLFALTTCLSSCWNPFEKKRKKSNSVTYFIHGDPLSLVSGTETSPSFLTLENRTSFDQFHLASAASFIEREPQAAPTTFEEVEKKNSTEAPEDELYEGFELEQYSFVQEGPNRFVYAPINGAKGYRIGFEARDGLLHIVDFNNYPVTPQHYSLKTDGKAFSVLFSYELADIGKIISAFYFADSAIVNPLEKAVLDYAYLFDILKIRWDEPIKVEACGKFSSNVETSIKSSVFSWYDDDTPTETKRSIIYSKRETYAPFSDMNQNCIFLVSQFKLENSTEFYTAGVTIPIVNLASKFIVSSDVLLFVDHPQVSIGLISGEKSPVLMHEMGHFFGLGHEFKKDTTGAALHPSIMGYSQGKRLITSWDYQALRDLYGQSLGSAEP